MRTRRTKKKYSWFPVRGTAGGTDTDNLAPLFFTQQVVSNPVLQAPGATSVDIVPLIPDVPLEGDDIDVNAGGQLIQSLGQEYFLERIVGNLFLTFNTDLVNEEEGAGAALCGAGIFVARANDSDAGGGQNSPIGSATVAERQENYSPLSEECIREPWLWRRTWILGTNKINTSGAAASGNNREFSTFPATNAAYVGSMNGPFIDTRSVRRVGNDERLWFAFANCSMTGGDNPEAQALIQGVFDYRVLGRLARARGKSSF